MIGARKRACTRNKERMRKVRSSGGGDSRCRLCTSDGNRNIYSLENMIGVWVVVSAVSAGAAAAAAGAAAVAAAAAAAAVLSSASLRSARLLLMLWLLA